MKHPPRHRTWVGLWPCGLLLAQVLVFYWRVLFGGHYVIPWDFRYYHFPLAWRMAAAFRAGELPLWDPFTYCGRPLYANLTTQLFYPPTPLAVLLSHWTGGAHLLYFLELQLIAHVFLAGVLAYWLLRRLELDRAPALIGATVFQLGAYFTSQAQHLGAVNAAAWMPMAWLAVVELARGFRWRWLAALAAALALAILGGFPAVTAVVFASTGMLALLLVVFRQGSPKLALQVAGAAAWAVLLAAVQLFPSMELTRLSVASYRGDWMGTGGGVPLQALVSLVWPNYWGVFQFRGDTWKLPWNPTFLYLYCGVAALALAAWALLRRRQPVVLALAAVTAISFLWMLGDSTPVGRTLYPLLPAAVRGPLYAEFAMAAWTLGLAGLAGFGAQAVLARRGAAVRALAVVVVAAELIAAGSGRPMNTADERDEAGIAYEQVDGVPDLPRRARSLVRRTVPPARIDVINASLNWSGGAALIEVPSANGDDPFALIRTMQVRLLFCKGQRWGRYYEVADPGSPVLDLLNVRYIFSREARLGAPLVKTMEMPGLSVYENPGWLPRFFLVGRARQAAGMEAAVAALRAPDFDPRTEAVVEGRAPALEPGGARGTVRVLQYRANELALEVDAPARALLVTSEAWYPGWRAWLDGREQPPLLVNAAFRGVAVPAGRHLVWMRFEPGILARSALVSLAAALALAVAPLVRLSFRRRGVRR